MIARRRLARFIAHRGGAIGPVWVLALAGVLGLGALTYNVSQFSFLKRRQQGMTDLAALAAAANLPAAQKAAQASLTGNRIAAANLLAVEPGIYVANANLPVAQRFTPATSSVANAARVKVKSTATGLFSVFFFAREVAIGTQAIAASSSMGAIAVGPPPSGIDPAAANGLLGGLIGAPLNLTAAGYLALGAGTVDAFALAAALARRIGFGGTYADLGRTSVRLSDVYAAAADVQASQSAPTATVAAMRTIATAASVAGPRFAFGNLVAFDGYPTRTVGADATLTARLPLLPLITAAARLGAGTVGNKVSVPVTGLASGLSAAKFVLAIRAPTTGSAFAAVGPTGVTVKTLETRAAVTLQLPGLDKITAISLSLYFQSPSATARLAALAAGSGGASATLGAAPGVATAWIGSVPDAALTNWAVTPQPGPATLVDMLLLKVTGSAQTSVGTGGETPLAFSPDDVAACRMKATSGDSVTTPLTSLFSSLKLQVSILGIGIGSQNDIVKSVNTALQNSLAPVASTLGSTLPFLGINLGAVGGWTCTARTGQARLVN